MYDSDAFIEEHDRVQHATLPPDDPDCKREKVVTAMMFWSDLTHLANFRMAKLWPIYMMLGNLSKYVRALPSSGACMYVAYIPHLVNSFEDFASTFHCKWGTQRGDILTHCQRELILAIWSFLLDNDFLHAYTYGIIVQCIDGIEWHVYPCIFTYSADYPEKYAHSLCHQNLGTDSMVM
jgi:Plavaka transposase